MRLNSARLVQTDDVVSATSRSIDWSVVIQIYLKVNLSRCALCVSLCLLCYDSHVYLITPYAFPKTFSTRA